jgi:Protein of unknown function (DUF3187)
MRRMLVVVVILWGFWGGGRQVWSMAAKPTALPYGPLRLVNQQPLQLLFLQQFPDLVTPVEAGHVLAHFNVALTNTLVRQQRNFTADLDLEMVRAVLDLHYGLLPNLEVGMDVPFLFTYGGILDDFIEGVERAFRGLRILRGQQDSGAFTYRVLRGSEQFIGGRQDSAGIGDVVLKVKLHVLHEQSWLPAVGVRAALKMPTGSSSRAFGSGEVDGGLGILLQKTFGRWTFYMNGDITFPGKTFDEVEMQPFFGGMLAVEFQIARSLSMVGQFRGDSRPFRNSIPILDRRIFEVLLGFNWVLSRSLLLQGGFAEDIRDSACCSADVSFFLNLTGRL